MASLLEKVGLLFSATLHNVVDEALKSQNVAVMNEFIRRAQGHLDEVEDTLALQRGDLKIQTKKRDGLIADIAKLDGEIRTLLGAGKDALAAAHTKSKLAKETALAKCNAEIERIKGMENSLETARVQLVNKIDEMKDARDHVERALETAKAQNKTVRTLDDVAEILGDDGVLNLVSEAERKAEQADARFQMAMEKHATTFDAESDPAVAAELARIKAEMASSASIQD